MPSKYRNQPVIIDNITFPSKAEGRRYEQLRLLERAGKISSLEVHPKFPIVIDGRPLRAPDTKAGHVGRQYVVEMDFSFFDLATGARVIIDTKGFDNPMSRIKRSLVEHIYHVKITVEK